MTKNGKRKYVLVPEDELEAKSPSYPSYSYSHPPQPYSHPPQPYSHPPQPYSHPSQPYLHPPQPYLHPPQPYSQSYSQPVYSYPPSSPYTYPLNQPYYQPPAQEIPYTTANMSPYTEVSVNNATPIKDTELSEENPYASEIPTKPPSLFCFASKLKARQCKREMEDEETQTAESSTKSTETTESTDTSFRIPLKKTSLQKPDGAEGLFQILFPKKTTSEKEEDDAPTKRRDRSIFLDGIAVHETIETLEDLISLAKRSETDYDKEVIYALDFVSLRSMLPSLEKLQAMVGLADIKQQIVNQVLFYLQGLDNTNRDMLHTVIEGEPGVGKTEIAKILGEIYGCLGILSKGSFTSVKRADLVGSYLGQTASKTLKVLKEAKGGVLFIDEAYSLGNQEGKDMYSKECIDTITAFLSENRDDFVCIIAGYKNALKECFFKYNAGLERRFPWTYTIKSYTAEELQLIFQKMVEDQGWAAKVDADFFKSHYKKFRHFGGDLENLFHKTKLAHSKRALSILPEEKRKVTMSDLEEGMRLFQKDEEDRERLFPHMAAMYS